MACYSRPWRGSYDLPGGFVFESYSALWGPPNGNCARPSASLRYYLLSSKLLRDVPHSLLAFRPGGKWGVWGEGAAGPGSPHY